MIESLEPIRFIPRIHSKEMLLKRCEGYFRNEWFTSERYGPVAADFADIWSCSGPERSWRFQHHSLVSVSHLLDGYAVDGDIRYLKMAEKLILNWFEVNFPVSPSEMGWHDHSTAYRLANICRFFSVWSNSSLGNENEANQFELIVEKHAEKLMDDEFYMPEHNHGLEQDIALYTAAKQFSHMEKSSKWEEKSIRRFWRQVTYLFAEDGSYLEHSPQYVYSLLKTLYSFLGYLQRVGYHGAEKLEERLNNAFKFLICTTRPDWRIPSIGDSENSAVSPFVLKSWSDRTNELMEGLMKHRDEKEALTGRPLPVDSVFFDGGFAALRNKWDWSEDAIHFITYSGFHSRVHKHHDDLSFVLFAKGREIITEGGKFNYNYTSEERKYVVSPYAHNSVMADGKAADIPNRNKGKSGLLSAMLTKNVAYVSGMHALYKNINHRRFYLYLKPDVILIFDQLKGYSEHKFETFFNLHSDLECEQYNETFYGCLENEEVISLSQIYTSSANFESETAIGKTGPLKGWVSPKYGEFVPNTLISFKTEGMAVNNVYQISLGASLKRNDAAAVGWDGTNISVKWRNYCIEIELTDFHEHIFINDKYYRSQKHFNSRLMEAATENEVEHVQAKRKNSRIREGLFT
ncbi:heparinase II/III family protein [Cytobacillus firmus]|uniref:heparinase II/III domain-containing protein n=1 Tax=Cytobacillus firmus TaxID=1399 RepID=UPI00384E728E